MSIQTLIEQDVQATRRVLETRAIAGNSAGTLSTGQVAELLGLSIDEANGYLRAHGTEPPFSLEDYRKSQTALETLLAQSYGTIL